MPRARDDTFIIYYWNEYEEFVTDNPSCFYCLSESTIQLCLSALRFAGWPTRWRLNKQDGDTRLRDREIWNKIDGIVALAHKELMVDMSCDLQAGFDTLAQAIIQAAQITANNPPTASATATANCGSTSSSTSSASVTGVSGAVTQDSGEVIPLYGTEEPLQIEHGEFPEGYNSREEYLLDKCQMANLIVDSWIDSLLHIGAFGVFNYVALLGLIVVAITGVIVFPPAFIPTAAALIGVLSVGITIVTVLANAIKSNRHYFVCLMYNSDSVQTIVSGVADVLDSIIATLEVSNVVGYALKQLALLLINGDTLNQLFKKTAHIQYPDADCSDCTIIPATQRGTNVLDIIKYIELNVETELESTPVTGWGGCGDTQHTIVLVKDPGYQWQSIVQSGAIPCPDYPGTRKIWSLYDAVLGGLIYDSNTPPDFPEVNGVEVVLLSSVPFTATVLVTEV